MPTSPPYEDRDVNPVGVKGGASSPTWAPRPRSPTRSYHATGVRVRDVPIRIEKLLTA
jgi:CO/xanthine dehydrogenase Mo-binding subunit